MDSIEIIQRNQGQSPNILEEFGMYITQRTNPNDQIQIKVIWKPGNERPRLLANFKPRDPAKKSGWVEFSNLLPDAPGRKNPVSGTWEGFYTWKDAMLHTTNGVAVGFEGMVRRSGRIVSVIEERQ